MWGFIRKAGVVVYTIVLSVWGYIALLLSLPSSNTSPNLTAAVATTTTAADPDAPGGSDTCDSPGLQDNDMFKGSCGGMSCSQRVAAFSAGVLKDGEDPSKLSSKDWKKRLTPEQYQVARGAGTEMPFSGKWYNHHEEGVYTCACCGAELFESTTKYESGSGWPSFWMAKGANGRDDHATNVSRREDATHGMVRVEVLCRKCEAHLGHVFPDGPEPTGLRYCINSASLGFDKRKLTKP